MKWLLPLLLLTGCVGPVDREREVVLKFRVEPGAKDWVRAYLWKDLQWVHIRDVTLDTDAEPAMFYLDAWKASAPLWRPQ